MRETPSRRAISTGPTPASCSACISPAEGAPRRRRGVAGGRIEVDARRDGDMLVLSVLDSGVGLGSAAPSGDSRFGLAQVRERLHTLYGSRASLELQDAAGGGTRARIRLPLPT
jgi:sensor histidine kinase YesM